MATDELAPGTTTYIVTLPNQFHGEGSSSPRTSEPTRARLALVEHQKCHRRAAEHLWALWGHWCPSKTPFRKVSAARKHGVCLQTAPRLSQTRGWGNVGLYSPGAQGETGPSAEPTARRAHRVPVSPAPGKVTCGPGSFAHVMRPRPSPGQCQHSKGRAAPKQHTWDHKYRLIYIILRLKGTKRLIAFQLGLGLHQRPQELIPSAAEARARCESSSSSSRRKNPPFEPGNAE